MIKNISFKETESFFIKNNFSNFLLYEFDNKDLYGVFYDENLSSVIIKSGGFCYFFSVSYFHIDEIRAFIELYKIKEIISNVNLGFINEKPCYFMTKKIKKSQFESKYNFQFENNIKKIKAIYETLIKSKLSLFDFEEFYISLFYRNKDNKLKLYGIFEDEKNISSAILFLINDSFAKLTSVATCPEFQKRGFGHQIISDICCDSSLIGKTIYLFCEEDYVLDFYKKEEFVLQEKLFLYRV